MKSTLFSTYFKAGQIKAGLNFPVVTLPTMPLQVLPNQVSVDDTRCALNMPSTSQTYPTHVRIHTCTRAHAHTHMHTHLPLCLCFCCSTCLDTFATHLSFSKWHTPFKVGPWPMMPSRHDFPLNFIYWLKFIFVCNLCYMTPFPCSCSCVCSPRHSQPCVHHSTIASIVIYSSWLLMGLSSEPPLSASPN